MMPTGKAMQVKTQDTTHPREFPTDSAGVKPFQYEGKNNVHVDV